MKTLASMLGRTVVDSSIKPPPIVTLRFRLSNEWRVMQALFVL
jgi:hypothetical protein